MTMADADQIHCETPAQWSAWLAENHASSSGAWLVLWRPSTGKARLTYDEAILEGLCWGWVDGQSKPLDDERSMLWFTRRNPRSAWSATNKRRVEKLEAEGRIEPAGWAAIEIAKQNGRWTVLDGVEDGIEPEDLAAALSAVPAARKNWDGFTLGRRKLGLSAVALAVKPETRARRIATIVENAARGVAPE